MEELLFVFFFVTAAHFHLAGLLSPFSLQLFLCYSRQYSVLKFSGKKDSASLLFNFSL